MKQAFVLSSRVPQSHAEKQKALPPNLNDDSASQVHEQKCCHPLLRRPHSILGYLVCDGVPWPRAEVPQGHVNVVVGCSENWGAEASGFAVASERWLGGFDFCEGFGANLRESKPKAYKASAINKSAQ